MMFQKDWVVVHYDVSPRHFQTVHEVSTIVHGVSESIWMGFEQKSEGFSTKHIPKIPCNWFNHWIGL